MFILGDIRTEFGEREARAWAWNHAMALAKARQARMTQETPSQTSKDKTFTDKESMEIEIFKLQCCLKAAQNDSDHYEAECDQLRSQLTEATRERELARQECDILREKANRMERAFHEIYEVQRWDADFISGEYEKDSSGKIMFYPSSPPSSESIKMREEHQTTPEVEALRAKVANLESMLEKIRGLQRWEVYADIYGEAVSAHLHEGEWVRWEDLSAIVLHEV